MPLEETFAWLRPQIPVVPWWMKHSNGKPSSNSMIFYMNLWAINLHLCRRSMDFPLRCLIHGFESWRLQGTSRGCFGSLLRGVAFVMLVMFKSFSEREILNSCHVCPFQRREILDLLLVFLWFFGFSHGFSLFGTMVPIDPGSTTMLSGAKQDPSLCGIVGIPPGPVVSASHAVRRGLR